jgi:hypothetical protein
MARIDAPYSGWSITFFSRLVFDIVQLPRFFHRINGFAVLDLANVTLDTDSIRLIPSTRSQKVGTTWIDLRVSCRKLDWQLSSLSQVCTSTLSTLSNLEHLNISEGCATELQNDIENVHGSNSYTPFPPSRTCIYPFKSLPMSRQLFKNSQRERVAEVLPALQVLFLDELEPSGIVQEPLQEFVAARQHSGYPVAVRRWGGRD